MRILEVQESSKLKQAGEILQKLFHKQNRMMQWASDTKPNLTELTNQLNDPFLNMLVKRKDLDLYIKYADLYLNLDTSNIFDTKSTGTANGTDMMRDPTYFKEKKGRVFKIVYMSPHQYLAATNAGFNDNSFQPGDELVEEYAYKTLDGSKMPLPYLEYKLVQGDERRDEYTSFNQEGRHRATVANLLGAKEMPVMIIAAVDPAWKMMDRLEEFQEKVFSRFK